MKMLNTNIVNTELNNISTFDAENTNINIAQENANKWNLNELSIMLYVIKKANKFQQYKTLTTISLYMLFLIGIIATAVVIYAFIYKSVDRIQCTILVISLIFALRNLYNRIQLNKSNKYYFNDNIIHYINDYNGTMWLLDY